MRTQSQICFVYLTFQITQKVFLFLSLSLSLAVSSSTLPGVQFRLNRSGTRVELVDWPIDQHLHQTGGNSENLHARATIQFSLIAMCFGLQKRASGWISVTLVKLLDDNAHTRIEKKKGGFKEFK